MQAEKNSKEEQEYAHELQVFAGSILPLDSIIDIICHFRE